MRIKDVMTTNVKQIAPAGTIDQAKTLMRLHGVHQLVVVDGRLVKGVVTAHQVAEARDGGTVEEIMSHHAVTAPAELTIRKAANLLRGSAAGALPVLERGRLVGIVTVSDLLELVGRGAERPVEKGKRWTLRHRGAVPAQARAIARR